MTLQIIASSINPRPTPHTKARDLYRKKELHIKNVHKSLQKSIQNDLHYIKEHCSDDIDMECIIRWDRIASISKSTKDFLKKFLLENANH